MGVFNIVKKGISAGWNVSGWLGVSNIKKNAVLIKELSKDTFNVKKTKQGEPKQETFTEAVKRLNLTEQDIQKRIKASGQIIFFCGLLTIPMAAYTLYMFMAGFYLSTFVCVMLTALLLAYCFREHFNRFQMLQRRLSCSIGEWASVTFRLKSARNK